MGDETKIGVFVAWGVQDKKMIDRFCLGETTFETLGFFVYVFFFP